MDKMLVVAFDDESKAYEGVKSLKELHTEGSLTLYATAVITKDAKGVIVVKQAVDQGPIGTAVGMATGSLIGLLGGPVGLAVGAAAGTLSGSMYDMAQVGVNMDFLDEVSKYLSPGKMAVVAEVEEEWVTPLDTRMEALGGVVFRRVRGEFIDDQIEREIAAENAEIAALQAEHDQAVGEVKAKLQAKIDATQRRLQARNDALNEKIAAVKREGEAKIKLMVDQETKVQNDAKAKLEDRIAEMRTHHEARVDKLSQAWKLIKEAARI
jgi:uncharacterized membrane protein